jgi:hypothetical protein
MGRVPRRTSLPHAGPQCLGFKDAGRTNHPHLPKDNEGVKEHVTRLEAMLNVATVAKLVYDQDDGD